jgi:hypothetical protein
VQYSLSFLWGVLPTCYPFWTTAFQFSASSTFLLAVHLLEHDFCPHFLGASLKQL